RRAADRRRAVGTGSAPGAAALRRHAGEIRSHVSRAVAAVSQRVLRGRAVSEQRDDLIIITGAAVATSLGLTRGETWRAIVQGRCGMVPMTALETPLPPDKLGGQAVELPADYRPTDPREGRYLAWTIRDALREAGALDQFPY